MDLQNRARKVSVENLSMEQTNALSVQIGEKITNICDSAANKINDILSIYGLSAKIAIKINGLNDKPKRKKAKLK